MTYRLYSIQLVKIIQKQIHHEKGETTNYFMMWLIDYRTLKSLDFRAIRASKILMWKDSVFENLISSLEAVNFDLRNRDIICISSKLFSIQQERAVSLDDVVPSSKAIDLENISKLDPRLIQIILDESDEILGVSPHSILTINDKGMYSNAGVDMSNVPDNRALLLARNLDDEAKDIRTQLEERFNIEIVVIIVDTKSLPMKDGTMGSAIGISGINPIKDMRGSTDLFGKEYELTKINIVESIAATANLLLGETDEQTPYTIVRGLDFKREEISLSKTMIPKEYCLYFGPILRKI